MPVPVPDNAVRAAKKQLPLDGAFRHLEYILDLLCADGGFVTNSSTAVAAAAVGVVAVVDAVEQHLIETSSILPLQEQMELQRLATWPSNGIPINDVQFLIDSDENGKREAFPRVEAWLIELCTSDPVIPIQTVRRKEDIDWVGQAVAKAGLVPVMQWLVAQTGWMPPIWNSPPCWQQIRGTAVCRDRVDILKCLDVVSAEITAKHGGIFMPAKDNDDTGYVCHAVKCSSLEVLKWYANRGKIDFSVSGWKLIELAVEYGRLDVLKWLASLRPTVSGLDFSERDNRPARIAAHNKHLDVLDWLAQQTGVDADALFKMSQRNHDPGYAMY